MKKHFFALILLIFCVFSACSCPAQQDKVEKAAARIEQALPEGYEKQSQTEVYDFIFTNEQGSEMTYFICLTTYKEDIPESVNGLDVAVLSAVFDIENTSVQTEFEVSGHPVAIYQVEEVCYACCTPSPETSMVLKYDPDVVTEADAIKVIESIFSNPQ